MKQEVLHAERRKEAREIAAHTFVLLKNNNQALPLKKQERSV
jgi:beta-glucosidase